MLPTLLLQPPEDQLHNIAETLTLLAECRQPRLDAGNTLLCLLYPDLLHSNQNKMK